MNRFKVGDLVTGNELNNYGLTDASATCKVVKILSDRFMWVVILKHPTYNGDTEFLVEYKKIQTLQVKVQRK